MIDTSQMGVLLLQANRLGLLTYQEGAAQVWADVLAAKAPTIDYQLATRAMQELATQPNINPRGIRPYDLIQTANALAAKQADRVPVEFPPGLDVDQTNEWRRAWTHATGRGATADQARDYAESQTGISFPPALASVENRDVKDLLNKLKNKLGKD